MNDADEDDLEIYDHATSRGKSRTAFDVNDVHDEDHVATKKQISASYTSQASVQTPQSRQVSTHRLFSDGSPVQLLNRGKQLVFLVSRMAPLCYRSLSWRKSQLYKMFGRHRHGPHLRDVSNHDFQVPLA